MDKKNNILILYLPAGRRRAHAYPPLGLAVLAGYLRRRGFETVIDDLEAKIEGNGFLPSARLWMNCLSVSRNNREEIFLDREKVNAYLENNRHAASFEKIFSRWLKCLNRDVSGFNYVGFSVMSIDQLSAALCFSCFLKKKLRVKIVFGGSFFSSKTAAIMERYPFPDYIVLGLQFLMKADF